MHGSCKAHPQHALTIDLHLSRRKPQLQNSMQSGHLTQRTCALASISCSMWHVMQSSQTLTHAHHASHWDMPATIALYVHMTVLGPANETATQLCSCAVTLHSPAPCTCKLVHHKLAVAVAPSCAPLSLCPCACVPCLACVLSAHATRTTHCGRLIFLPWMTL